METLTKLSEPPTGSFDKDLRWGLENEMIIILYSLTKECSVPAVSRNLSGVEELPGDVERGWCV